MNKKYAVKNSIKRFVLLFLLFFASIVTLRILLRGYAAFGYKDMAELAIVSLLFAITQFYFLSSQAGRKEVKKGNNKENERPTARKKVTG